MDSVVQPGASLSPEAALARIPGWEAGCCTPLDGGETNTTWLVENNGQKAVLKVDPAPRQAPFNGRVEEARIQGLAAAAGLANAVLYADDTVLLTDYVEGRVWTKAGFDDSVALEALARALRQLHALPLTGRTFDALGAARAYAGEISDGDPEMIAHSLRIIEAMPRPRNLCCCHNDLVAANIISAPDIRFLDWEYACDNDPFFDLATIVAHHQLSTRQAEVLLDAYFDGDGERWQPQLVASERPYDALNWLWRKARQHRAQGSVPLG